MAQFGQNKQSGITQIEVKRRKAYAEEADPLFFKWQRGEKTKEEWENKVAEIKERFKYPE